MLKTIKARYSRGIIELLEKVDIAEGTELIVTVAEIPPNPKATAWKGPPEPGRGQSMPRN